MVVPPQMQLFIHRSCKTSGDLAEGKFALTGALWAHAFSQVAVAWILAACLTCGSFGHIRDFDQTWASGRRLVWTGRRNKALDRAWDKSRDRHQVEIRGQRTALRIFRNGVFWGKRVGGSYTWLCSVHGHFWRCFCGVDVLFCTAEWRGWDGRRRRG